MMFHLDFAGITHTIPRSVFNAGIAQLVEHDLAKVGVASSSLVSRSRFFRNPGQSGVLFFLGYVAKVREYQRMARWQSGHAAACKAVYAGSIPTLASIRYH